MARGEQGSPPRALPVARPRARTEAGQSASAGAARATGCRHGVAATARPLAPVSTATTAMAARGEAASAPIPAMRAPSTNPKSLQKRYTPTTRARSRGWRRVGDGGDQGRIDHRGPDAEERSGGNGRREAPVPEHEQPECARLNEHPPGDQRLAPRVVREPSGQELPRAPDERVDGRRPPRSRGWSRRWRRGRAGRGPTRARR